MDYAAMAECHWQHNADITVAVQPVAASEAHRLGILKRDSEGRIVGVIGVIGPTRLNYARVIPMVDYTARVVSRLLAG